MTACVLSHSCGGDGGPAEPSPSENIVVSVDPTAFSIEIGESQTIVATVTGTSNTQVRWESSSTSIAVVSSSGLVTGRQAGAAVIRARSIVDANKSATATVTVTESRADLVIDQVMAAAVGSIGGTVNTSVTIRNQGEATDRAFRAGFYYSSDAIITSADVFSGFFCSALDGLAAGATRSCTGPIGVPGTLTPGTYYLGAIADDQLRVDETNEGNNARAATTTTRLVLSMAPDLVVDSIAAPATGTVGGSIAVAMTVRNQGLPTTTTFRVGFYYSTDAMITTADVFSGTSCAYAGGLGANAADVCDGAVAVPSTLAPGSYYLGAIADDQARVAEDDETNNARATSSAIAIGGAAPDLVVDAVTVPITATAGSVITVSATVRNQGGAAAGAYRIGYHFSFDSVITTADPTPLVCERTGLAPGATSPCSGTATLTSAFPAGTYFVGVIVDDLGQVSEADEGNNVRAAAAPIVVTGGSADLVITAFTVPATAIAGASVPFSATVRNQGSAGATTFHVGYYFSSDSVVTTADTPSTSSCVFPEGLQNGVSTVCPFNVTVPASLTPGPYWVGAIADDEQEVSEGNEANNVLRANAVMQVAASASDFIVETLTVPASGHTGDSIGVTVTVRNVGAPSTVGFRTGYYYSTDATITTADVFSGFGCSHGPLGANGTGTCIGNIPVPGSLPPGTYYVGAIADDVAAVTEANESNNTRAAGNTTTITLGPINLMVDGMYLTQSTQTYQGTIGLVTGRDAFLRVFVKGNRADPATPSVRVRFYRNGMLVDTRTISPGRSVAATIDEATLASSWNYLVPAALIQPGLSVLADVDPGQQVTEGNETDNTFPRNGTPQSIEVRNVPTFNVTLVPILTTLNGQTGNVNSGNAADYLADALKILPLVGYNATVRSAFSTNAGTLSVSGSWGQIISELDAVRVAEGGTRHFYGVMKAVPMAYACGIGAMPGRTAIAMDSCGPLTAGHIAAHEWGHNFGLQHALCGNVFGTDPQYPYANARIGIPGFDVTTQTLKLPEQNYDLMSYCEPAWISDYHYRKAFVHRADAATAPSVSESGPALLVWGRIEGEEVVLEPAFQIDAQAALPDESGPYVLEGLRADGGRAFSLAFAGTEIGGGEVGDRHFAFAVPVTWREGEVVSLRVRGPGGTAVARSAASAPAAPGAVAAASAAAVSRVAADQAEVRWNAAAYPMAMVRDASTGEILSFARGGAALIATGARNLELLLSDGVRSTLVRTAVAP